MNLSEMTASDFLNSEDYEVGTKWPPLTITKVATKPAPSSPKNERCVIWLEKAPKPWMISSRVVLREIGRKLGVRDIEKNWPGNKISIQVVGNVRRPDGTKGNAFRIAQIQKLSGDTVPSNEITLESTPATKEATDEKPE